MVTTLFICSTKLIETFLKAHRDALMTSEKNESLSCDEGKKVKESNLFNKAETLIMGTFYKIDPDL